MVLLKRVPNSGTPSTSSLAIGVTTPVWISPAAALVTAGVTPLVAPVCSPGRNGVGGTRALQSAAAAGCRWHRQQPCRHTDQHGYSGNSHACSSLRSRARAEIVCLTHYNASAEMKPTFLQRVIPR